MIVCQCNVLSEDSIKKAIAELVREDPYQLVTPGLVYSHMGKSGKCCGCFPRVVGLIIQKLEEFQSSNQTSGLDRRLAGAGASHLHAGVHGPALQRD